MIDLNIKRRKPIVRQLEEHYGGRWHYVRSGNRFWWTCENGRVCRRVSYSFGDDERDWSPPRYVIYSPLGNPAVGAHKIV